MMNVLSLLYIAEYTDGDALKWGLFYDDKRGRQQLSEDFKPVSFATEKEAKDKLASIEAERSRENSALSFSLEEAKAFVDSHKWKYATTYAKTAPHEYLVKKWLSESDRQLFERLVQTINNHAVTGYFYEHKNKYLILEDRYYWYMPCYPDNMAVDLINRTTTDYLEYRDGTYHYKPQNLKKD